MFRSLLRRTCFWRWLFSGWILLYLAVLLSAGGQPHARLWFRCLALGWLVLLAGLLSAFTNHGLRSRWLRGLDLAAFNLALFLFLGELSLRAHAMVSGRSLLVSHGMDAYRLEPNRNYGDLLFTNSAGYASREFVHEKQPGLRRIAALGDSFAVGVVRQDQNYLNRLETLFSGVEVYNFGLAGAGPREYLAILQSDVWPNSPDLVLLSVFVGNDITESRRLPSAKRLDPEGHHLFLFGQRLWRLGREWARQEFGGQERRPFAFPQLSRETHLEVECNRLRLCLTSEMPHLARHWTRALDDLEKLVRACRARQTPLAVVLIPDEYQVNPELLEQVLQSSGRERREVDLELPQRRLAEFFARRQVPCLDLLPVFRNVSGTYRPRDTHWNEAGNRLAAETIASWLPLAAPPPFHRSAAASNSWK